MPDFAAVIPEIYQQAQEQTPWTSVLRDLSRFFNASGAFLFTTYVPATAGGLGIAYGLPEETVDQFLKETADVDVWYQELVRKNGPLRTGFTCTTDHLLSDKALRRTRFFSDYLAPSDIGRCISAIVSDGSPASPPLAPLCFYRPLGSSPFGVREMRAMQELTPHFARAMQLRWELEAARQGHAELAMHRVVTAVVVLGRDRRILYANPAAERFLCRPATSITRDRRLSATDPRDTAALEKAISACATYRFETPLSFSIRLAGPIGAGIVARLVPPPPGLPNTAQAASVAFLSEEGQSGIDTAALASSLYGLSAAETRLLAALVSGTPLEAIATVHCVELSTVKSQLQSIFSKTGTRRQSDLVRLMYSIAR
ncbi:helix-turn-helix transcriptional regulator [Cupriavidus numazuensis]|nr:hypothetical protein [Cupriavidus numazuensis]